MTTSPASRHTTTSGSTTGAGSPGTSAPPHRARPSTEAAASAPAPAPTPDRNSSDPTPGGHRFGGVGSRVFGTARAGGRAPWHASDLTPGLALTILVTAVVMVLTRFVPMVSPLLVAIVVGALLANCVTLPERVRPGLAFSSKKLLRLGVALLGLQLTFSDLLGLGPAAIGMVVAVVTLGITATMWMGKLLGLSWTQRVLIACGFSICGAAAAAAVDGVVDAEEEELLTTVALVVVFGTAMIGVVPLLSGAFGLDDRTAGMWAGGAVHEVAQVVAAGSALGGSALAVAVIVKLARVVLLAPVLAVIGRQQRRRAGSGTGTAKAPLMPLFVIAFLACAAVRTTGLVPTAVLDAAQLLQTALLTAAMFALGAGVRVAALRRVGYRPLLLALLSTIWVAGVALVGAVLAG